VTYRLQHLAGMARRRNAMPATATEDGELTLPEETPTMQAFKIDLEVVVNQSVWKYN
jgi:hypothetical protein